MPETRVLIFAMPRLLDDIFDRLLSDEAGVIVLRIGDEAASSLVDAAARTRADLVIVDAGTVGPREVSDLLDTLPHAQALSVAGDARTGVLYRLCPEHRTIELSEVTVRSAIREVRARDERFFESRSAP